MLPRSLLPFPELSPSGSQHRLTGTWHAAKESYLIFAKHWNKFTLAIRKRILPTSCTMWCFGKWSLATESPRGKNAMQVSLHWQNMLWLHCIQNCPSVVASFWIFACRHTLLIHSLTFLHLSHLIQQNVAAQTLHWKFKPLNVFFLQYHDKPMH